VLVGLAGCGAAGLGADPASSEVHWVVPSPALPAEAAPLPSNNNLAISRFDGRLYLAWRSSATHFASALTRMLVVSSGDQGRSWQMENVIVRGTDLREPLFVVMGDRLVFYFIELGVNPAAFEPRQVLRMSKAGQGSWSPVEPAPLPKETVVWDIKTHQGAAYMTAYRGNHYATNEQSNIDLYFKISRDGLTWDDVDPAHPVVYQGGVSEVGFEFDPAGNLWGVTRNEDGDASGFGSQVVFAPADALGKWQFPERSSPFRYDSPRMFRNGSDLYLVARRNVRYDGDQLVEAPYDTSSTVDSLVSFAVRKARLLATYSSMPKRTSIYRIDQTARKLVWLEDLPSAADTAFASILEIGPGKFLVANYTNPVDTGGFDWASAARVSGCAAERWSWFQGQTSLDCGTRIYFATLTFH
jgi:hypothetical protein